MGFETLYGTEPFAELLKGLNSLGEVAFARIAFPKYFHRDLFFFLFPVK